MFVRERRQGLQLCNREMFGDLVVVRQNALTMPPPSVSTTSPSIGRRRAASASYQDPNEKKENEKKRVSQLIDELLLEIYNRTDCGSSGGYTTATSPVPSQSSYQKYNEVDLQTKDSDEVTAVLQNIHSDVVRMGNALVRKLKRRDALRRQKEAHCDVITGHLRKRASEPDEMHFSVEPAPGDSGFNQWHSAMRMVSQLPGGIPPEFRRKLWLNLAERHLSSRNVKWANVERDCFSEWSHPADTELGVQIVKDLHRTGCSLFCGEGGQENQALLKRVLLAYARWNKAVGYCQGFNMLAALILQVTEKCEPDALKLMIFLIEGVLPESYFADSLRGLSVDMAVFRELLKTRLPRLSKHLDTLQTAAKDGTTSYEPPLTNVFTMQWFLTLFCNCLPQPTVLRVWDLILLEGNEILLRTALAIWQALAERILSVRSADEFYCIMGVLTREILEFGIVDANSLVKAIVTIGPLTELPSLREKYLYNINPWSTTSSRSLEVDVGNRQLKVYGKERLALDISALKKQYSKLKQRQRQAHIIFNAAVARQPPANAPVVAMNHLLLGKSAIIPAKRLGPPKGAVPPARQTSATLLWKDAPSSKHSSSSSSSDTELCDDPEEQEETSSPIPPSGSPINGYLKSDNLGNSVSDNMNLMKSDNSKEDVKLVSDDSAIDNLLISTNVVNSKPEITFDTGQIVYDNDNMDNNQIEIIQSEVSDIFDTTPSTKASEELFDFSKFGIPSDSDDDNVDFEKFLETRVRCLKESSIDKEGVASTSLDVLKYKTEHTRKNSQRALEIIQENSLILHRILQCQSRLTPSPIPLKIEQPNNTEKGCLSHDLSGDISEMETISDTLEASASPPSFYPHAFLTNNTKAEIGSMKYSICESNPSSIKQILEPKQDIAESNLEFKNDDESYVTEKIKIEFEIDERFPFSPTHFGFNKISSLKTDYPDADETPINSTLDTDVMFNMSYNNEEETQECDANESKHPLDERLNVSIKNNSFSDDNETRPSFTSILDSEYTRNLEEKYENLILKSTRPKFLDVLSSFDKGDSGGSSTSYKHSTSPAESIESPNTIKLPNSESNRKSPGEGSNFNRSPTSGRIYNPFPVNISSRQNKDVALRLGLYKKS